MVVDEQIGGEDSDDWHDLIADTHDGPEAIAAKNELRERVDPAVAKLKHPLCRRVIEWRLQDEGTLEEIGGRMNHCRERVRQLEQQAIGEVRRALGRVA